MQRVSGYQFYELAIAVHPITELTGEEKVASVAWKLHIARAWLKFFLNGDVVPLTVCKPNGVKLIDAINRVVPPAFPTEPLATNPEDEMGFQAMLVANEAKAFETVFAAELQVIDTYFISKKGIYVTSDLVESAEMALSDNVRSVISWDATQDFKEAGKCLAFDLATASGFHSMRATENVLRQYYAVATKRSTKRRSWAKCIEGLKKAGEDPKTLGVVDQIRDLHRNPLMHPEEFITIEQSQLLFDIAKSAISSMADRITIISASP